MFEGVPEQFHQFMASRTAASLPPPFPLLQGSSNSTTYPSFYPYTTASSQQVPVLQPSFLHPLHQGSPAGKDGEKQESNLVAMNLDQFERERSITELVNPWSNEEVLALLRIRSSMEAWFPEFTWEHVSRKLAEVGFKRSAEKCKEKFEEESRYFNSNINYHKNYRTSFGELEEIYHGDQNPRQEVTAGERNKKIDKPGTEDEEQDKMRQNLEEETRIDQTVGNQTDDDQDNNGKLALVEKSKINKRKREEKFEIFKRLCEDIVNTMMAQQEEMHTKLLEDMVKRDEEKAAKEEARKKLEMDKIDKELEIRAHEQALASDRQATLIKFLKKFTSGDPSAEIFGEKTAPDLAIPNSLNATSSSSLVRAQNPNPVSNESKAKAPTSSSILDKTNTPWTENQEPRNPKSTLSPNIPQVPTTSNTQAVLAPQNPNSLNSQSSSSGPPNALLIYKKVQAKSTSSDKDDIGKRWPRDEVLALINLRCSLYTNNEDKDGSAKAPLWERISQGMLESGYRRSAKRCKEKWENINKYFRKTKDVNKKRSMDSRTCPYFHQLSALYNQGTLVAPDNRSTSPENQSNLSETRHSSSSQNGTSNSTVHVGTDGDQKNMAQAPPFDFEF
uniref:Myb-like domain-containing protein n=1 Tax=Salix viminalis TaxID=40686 RepID=A0A6N2LX34_SALVM